MRNSYEHQRVFGVSDGKIQITGMRALSGILKKTIIIMRKLSVDSMSNLLVDLVEDFSLARFQSRLHLAH